MPCKRCGKCCIWLLVSLCSKENLDVDFIKARQLKVVQMTDDVFMLYTDMAPCQYLDKETMECSIYESRPGACRDYPRGRQELLPGCGFLEEDDA